MTITTFLDPNEMPSPDDDQIPFDNKMAAVFRALPQLGAEINSTAANLNSIAAGGAYAIPYTFSALTANVDPGAGFLRLSPTNNQNQSTAIYLDPIGADGKDYTSIIDTFDASTSAVKGTVRLVKANDPGKFLTFDVTSRSTPTGYRSLSITNTGGSVASPFATGDAIILFFQRTGDKGDQGTSVNGFSNLVVLATTQNWTVPAGITKGEITVVDGGQSGEGTTGITGGMGYGGQGGNGGTTVVTLSPGTTCTATIGAGGASTANGFSAGGATSFSGTGFTTVTSSSAALKVPGGASGFKANNTDPGIGGGTMLAPAGSTGYGAGGKGGTQGSGIAGKNGVVVIRY
jgi:hypothetical protein